MPDAERAIERIVRAYPNVKVVLSDSVFNDSYFHSNGADGGTLYINAELTGIIAAQEGWTGRIITSEALPDPLPEPRREPLPESPSEATPESSSESSSESSAGA